jgi:hypothetical protein
MNRRSFAPQLPVKWRDFEEGSDNQTSTSSSRHSGDTRHAVKSMTSLIPIIMKNVAEHHVDEVKMCQYHV